MLSGAELTTDPVTFFAHLSCHFEGSEARTKFRRQLEVRPRFLSRINFFKGVSVGATEQLRELQNRTGKPLDELVNEILDIHLDERRKNIFISSELKRLFMLYKENHNLTG